MNPYSDKYNEMSREALQCAIMMKNSPCLHFPDGKQIKTTLTDMDHFPYRRFFRGVYYESEPVIFGRDAGYRPYMNPGCSLNCSSK
jgi:hypothetical protein